MKKLIMGVIVVIILAGCIRDIKQNNKKGIDMEIKNKTFEEYINQKKFTLFLDKKIKGYFNQTIFLNDGTKIDYDTFIGDDSSDITENITTPQYPFVNFQKTYYGDTKGLKSIYIDIGEYSIKKYQEFTKGGELIKEEVYKQKSYIPYTTILKSLEKLGYLDLKKKKLIIGNDDKFELNYSLKSDIDIENIIEQIPRELQDRFNKSRGIWEYTINIQKSRPIINRRLILDDIDGFLLYQYDYKIVDTSEM